MAAWILESSYKYAKAAELARADGSLGAQSEVIAAFAMELLLKSLHAQPVENERYGGVGQQYGRVSGGHGLHGLFLMVPEGLRLQLGLAEFEELLLKKSMIFMAARYEYEAAAPVGFDDSLLNAFAVLMPKFVDHFISKGIDDPWLKWVKANPEQFALRAGTRLFL